MLHPVSGSVINTVFIHHSFLCSRNRKLPEIAVRNLVHVPFLPVVKISEYSDSGSGRRKGAEYGRSVVYMSAQIVIGIKNFSCIESIKIHDLLLIDNRHQLCF